MGPTCSKSDPIGTWARGLDDLDFPGRLSQPNRALPRQVPSSAEVPPASRLHTASCKHKPRPMAHDHRMSEVEKNVRIKIGRSGVLFVTSNRIRQHAAIALFCRDPVMRTVSLRAGAPPALSGKTATRGTMAAGPNFSRRTTDGRRAAPTRGRVGLRCAKGRRGRVAPRRRRKIRSSPRNAIREGQSHEEWRHRQPGPCTTRTAPALGPELREPADTGSRNPFETGKTSGPYRRTLTPADGSAPGAAASLHESTDSRGASRDRDSRSENPLRTTSAGSGPPRPEGSGRDPEG